MFKNIYYNNIIKCNIKTNTNLKDYIYPKPVKKNELKIILIKFPYSLNNFKFFYIFKFDFIYFFLNY